MTEWLLVLGLAVMTSAFRTFQGRLFHGLWVAGILATSFCATWFLFDHPLAGLLGVLIWPALPWIELLTRVRAMRLPFESRIKQMPPPPSSAFPALGDLTDEVEAEGFEFLRDVGWEWKDCRQNFRLLYRSEDRALAAICFISQLNISFFYISISSRDTSGCTWVTWNYPFPPHMKISPSLRLNRQPMDTTFFDMYQNHIGFLTLNDITASNLTPLDEITALEIISNEQRRELDHNLRAGILRRVDEESVAYSLRGLFYLWTQLIFHLLRAR